MSSSEARQAAARAAQLQQDIKDRQQSGDSPSDLLESTVLELLGMLRSSLAADRAASLAVLAEVVASAYGEDGAAIGVAVRSSGVLDDLRDMMLSPVTREQALLVIGNLVSDSVDPGSAATKYALFQVPGAAKVLIGCLSIQGDDQALVFACGALQNLCHDRDWSELLVQQTVHVTLESLLAHPNALVVRYASGALKNMMVTLQSATPSYSAQAADAVRQRSLLADVEEFSYRRAAATITRAIGRMPADVRLKRVIAGKAKLESAKAPQSSSRRAAPLSRVTGRPSGSAALPAHAACPKAPSSPHGSHSGSSASGSTTYFSVASLPSSQGPASAGKGAAPGGGSGACFEV